MDVGVPIGFCMNRDIVHGFDGVCNLVSEAKWFVFVIEDIYKFIAK